MVKKFLKNVFWLFFNAKSWNICQGSVARKISWYNEYFPESDKFIFQVFV